ncbi:MAG: electron transport complex subunit RsxC [Spirochaetota bacterium]|nr:electron transport complex subunit RsxC [Spirochaetota bacterium]
MALKTFRGGIHPSENKHFTEDKKFTNLSIPQLCYIPLQQHIGKPAVPVVEVGDTVQEGQLVGKAEGFVSANVHASVPGKVIEISEHPTVYSSKGLCIVIEVDGSFSTSWKKSNDNDWLTLGKEEILNRVRDAGIVGMGGAAFPTTVKLSPPENKSIDTLIINGSECEPYLTVDDLLMQTFPEEIIVGIRITLRILGIENAAIGIENNKPKAIASLQGALKKISFNEKIEIMPLKCKYPQGAEKQLIYSILKREVPSGGLPMDVGVVVQNVGTIFAIYEAVVLNKPLFERYLTVTGKIVDKPGNYKVRIGTKISDIINECGDLKENAVKIILGGPMCGISIDNIDIPVTKGTSGILFLSRKEVHIEDYRPCIRCGKCVSVCPVKLLPCELGNAVERDRMDLMEQLNPFDCILCGSCTYACPSRRPILHFVKVAQEKLRAKKSA